MANVVDFQKVRAMRLSGRPPVESEMWLYDAAIQRGRDAVGDAMIAAGMLLEAAAVLAAAGHDRRDGASRRG